MKAWRTMRLALILTTGTLKMIWHASCSSGLAVYPPVWGHFSPLHRYTVKQTIKEQITLNSVFSWFNSFSLRRCFSINNMSKGSSQTYQLYFFILGCLVLFVPIDGYVIHSRQDPGHSQFAILLFIQHFLPENVTIGPQTVLFPDRTNRLEWMSTPSQENIFYKNTNCKTTETMK